VDKYLCRAKPVTTGKRAGSPFAEIGHHLQQSTSNSRLSGEPGRLVVHPPAPRAQPPPPGFYGSWWPSAPSARWEGVGAAPCNPALCHIAGWYCAAPRRNFRARRLQEEYASILL